MSTKISKQQLVDVLNQWGDNQINTEQLQHWMLDNFEPDEFEIGVGESDHTIEAMLIVMNEYEIANEHQCLALQSQLAVNFINTSEADFMSSRHAFIQRAFCD